MFGFGQYVKEAYVSVGKSFRTYTVICTSILGGLLVCHLVGIFLRIWAQSQIKSRGLLNEEQQAKFLI